MVKEGEWRKNQKNKNRRKNQRNKNRGKNQRHKNRGKNQRSQNRGKNQRNQNRGKNQRKKNRGKNQRSQNGGKNQRSQNGGKNQRSQNGGKNQRSQNGGKNQRNKNRGKNQRNKNRGKNQRNKNRGKNQRSQNRGKNQRSQNRGKNQRSQNQRNQNGGKNQRSQNGGKNQRSQNGGKNQRSQNGGKNQRSQNGGKNQRSQNGGKNQRSQNGGKNQRSQNGGKNQKTPRWKRKVSDVMEELVNVSVSLAQIWRNKAYIDSTYIQEAIERNHALIPFLDPQRALRAGMVVVYGPSGSGKTTLAKKLILEWAEGRLSPSFLWAFYLSCRELSGVRPCTFLELLCLACSELEVDAMVRLLEKPREALVVLDGFEEMAFPEWSPEDDDCTDWLAEKPVHVLLSNLLRGNLVPKATLVVTTRPQALRELLSVASQPLFLSIEGFSDAEKLEYFRRQFRDPAQARRALEAVKGNPVLRELSAAPEVCRALCACLRPLMRRGEDPALACRTSTVPFLHFLYNKFSSCSRAMSSRLEALCCLAVQGLWARMSVFYLDDLEKLGVKEAFLSPFLVEHIIQKDWYYRGYCYSFTHLSFQQLLAALFYLLKRKHRPGQDRQPWEQRIKDVRTLLSKEAQEKNPDLAQAGLFFFGLLGHKRSLDLEAAFGCQMVLETRLQELLERPPRGGKPFLLQTRLSQVFSWLYESQDEELVQEALAPLEEMSVTLKSRQDLLQASFCLQHCPGLRRLTLQVAKGLFPEDSNELSTYLEDGRFPSDILNLWLDLCSYVCSGKDLSTLSIKQSFLSPSSARALRESLTSDKCCVEEVVIQYLSPESCYQDLCLALVGKKSLLCLGLEGHVRDDRAGLLALLGQMLRNEQCCLQTLRYPSPLPGDGDNSSPLPRDGQRPRLDLMPELASNGHPGASASGLGTCSGVTPQAWADFFLAIQACQFLTGLDLKENEILDQGAKLLCQTLMQPLYTMQKLSLENCQLTQACCKDLVSVLIVSQQLIYLSLACNDLGDVGVKILCEGLSHPDCQLQTLVLRRCSMGEDGCQSISKLLQEGCSLTSLDLSVNFIKSGLWMLCNALRRQRTKLRTLGLWGCAIRPLYCQELALVLTTNQDLTMLDLGQNSLGHNGIKVILEALKAGHTALKTLRLKMDELNQVVTLLKEVKHCHPDLVIEEVTNSSALSYWDFSPSP
ncbi:NACHT, LRR and PYD domains-containing protein 7-like [Thomomys bottae]